MDTLKSTHASDAISKKYKRLTDKEHVLHNSDTYIGSIEQVQEEQYVMAPMPMSEGTNDIYYQPDSILKEETTYIPGLYKLFDEAIVNCRDHVVRCQEKIAGGDTSVKPVSYINVSLSIDGSITVENDGSGIDIVEHPTHHIWVPELIFGHLRTGTNYDKSEKKIVGGKNGFGVKLIFIWSKYGYIETVDHTRGLKYTQEFKDNLSEICKPTITKTRSTKPYTRITFLPDYERMGIDGLTDGFKRLLIRRAYDIAAITDKRIKVKVDDKQIVVKDFQSYVSCYIGSDKQSTKRVYESPNERWEYSVSLTKNDCFEQISFVNGIATYKGGKHVDYIIYQLVRKIADYIQKKKKLIVKPNVIKEQIHLFLRCDIVNPAFSSQSKDYLDTPISKFGSGCQVSDAFAEKVAKMGVMDIACSMTEIKDRKANKRTDGVKTSSITGIPKLSDANQAGTKHSGKCMLILCEGDSAKAGILSGLTTDDRNTIGVYPLRGKLKNIRGVKAKELGDNAEINDIKKILGLKANMEFESKEHVQRELRYGKVIFMTDQDLDGTHIKGLCINMFDVAWNDLLKYGILGFMNTPILKASMGTGKNQRSLVFYNDGEYDQWKRTQTVEHISKYKVKYYKGLGTSTKQEFQEYFENKRIIMFQQGVHCADSIDMVFNKKKADERKVWLGNYDRTNYLDTNKEGLDFTEFINKEMIHFSKYDCERSIPNLMDGLKTSQRKILYSCFLKKLFDTEIKVAQLSGYVSEKSCYHHGEQSLNEAIISMAQTFVGSNNINLLMPNGQFGTRMGGGKDAASPRYIFTLLNTITTKLFRQEDNNVLDYLDDDGTPVEPMFYVPILPMILVNGANGIGTGFSTDVLPHNPTDIIKTLYNIISTLESDSSLPYNCGTETVETMIPQLIQLLDNHKTDLMNENNNVLPFFDKFNGSVSWISVDDHSRILVKGCYTILNKNEIRITELPIGSWIDKYKLFIENLIEKGKTTAKVGKKGKGKDAISAVVKEYLDMSTDTVVNFTLRLSSGNLYDMEGDVGQHEGTNGIHKLFNLATTMHLTNMNLFNHKEQLRKYTNYYDIIHEYTPIRLKHYILRKQRQQQELEYDLGIIANRVKYIQLILNDTIDLRGKKKDAIHTMLITNGLEEQSDRKETNDKNFNYLTKMPMDSVSKENVAKLNADYDTKQSQLDLVKNTSIYTMWKNELTELADVLNVSHDEPVVKKPVVKRKIVVKRK